MLVAFQSLMQSFIAPVTSLVGFGSTLQELQGDLHRLDDVLQHPAQPVSPSAPVSLFLTPTRLHGELQVRDVTFGYSRVSPPCSPT